MNILRKGTGSLAKIAYSYVYNYTDHLGNIRVSYVNNATIPTIIEENHYYPFGLKHKKYGQADPVPKLAYQYKYNGQEYQDELDLNVTAMDFRQYDNALGRFHNLDRLAELAPGISPYRFAFNKPNYWSDPTGLFESWYDAINYALDNNISGTIGYSGGDNGLYYINSGTGINAQSMYMIDENLVIGGTMIEGITVEGSSGGSSSGSSGGYFANYFKDYFNYKRPSYANAYSPYIPTNRDISKGLMTVGDGIAYVGYAAILSGVGAKPGIALVAVGNGISSAGLAFDAILDYQEGNKSLALFKVSALGLTPIIGSQTKKGARWFNGLKPPATRPGNITTDYFIDAQMNFYQGKMVENQENGNN